MFTEAQPTARFNPLSLGGSRLEYPQSQSFDHSPLYWSSLRQTLYSHFPPQHDLDLIIGEGRSALFVQSISNSYHELFVKGLECLNCVGVYLMNDGKLRKALPSLRRASVLAQFMGAHRGASSIKIRQHDPTSKISLETTWSHLNYCERYVSLLIGLPSPLTKGRFAAPTKPEHETDGEWLEKVHIDICKRVILRNQDDNRYDLVMTYEIDQQLNQAAASLSPDFWQHLEITPDMTQVDFMSRIISSMSQIIHYHLLTVLHIPFLHLSTTNHRFDQSKSTCLFACREVLARFASFRRIVDIVFCCLWVDFTAFTASMTLLLSHLTFPQQRSEWMLAHQRQSDRALIMKAMESMDTLNSLNGEADCRDDEDASLS
ncbi:hypothetical protein CC79DRAFT_1370753 [Sarocladium strictum]